MKMGKTRYFTGILLLAVLLAGVLTACAGSRKLSDKFDEAEVKAAAEEVIEILNEGDVDTLVDEKWNTVMKSMVEWFVKMVEERKTKHDSSKEKKNW